MSAARVRAELLAQRRALGPARTAVLSSKTIDRFLEGCGIAPSQWRGLQVALYRSLPGELDLKVLEERLQSLGAQLSFPRVLNAQGRLMELASGEPGQSGRDPSGPGGAWPKGAFGIEEPPAHHPAVDPTRLDLIFVPGVAFGLQGERLGMGAGFYDRFLPKALLTLRVALAFDFQLLPKLEQEVWDQRVDWIWTERRQIQLRPWKPE